ncbi:MAG: hypothetical protein COB39_02650 [Marinosulfonomonas sp.]|nr:MAG: hypothetical protein COB39_02650 [Marinosulfonomonas sp.]
MHILALATATFLMVFGISAGAETITFSIPQARQLARDAYLAGDARLANQLAHVLLEHDPKDATALVLIAATSPALGKPAEGRKAGRLAFRNTNSPVLKFEAAQFTAKAAFLEKRYGAAQLWLRRAAHVAPNDAAKERAIRGFRFVRSQNPWQTDLNLNFTPLSNINGGSDDDRLMIDDIWTVGVLSGDAQALSGYRLTVDAKTTHRLGHSETAATHAGLRFYQTLNALSGDAKTLAPSATGSDYNFSMAEVSLRHIFSNNPKAGLYSADLNLGHMWYGGESLASFGRLKFGRTLQPSPKTSVKLQVSAERQWQVQGNNIDIYALLASVSYKLPNNDRIGGSLDIRYAQSLTINSDYQGASLQLSYVMAKPIASAKVSFGIGASMRDYDAYRAGLFLAPDGRQDEKLNASISLFFEDINYMGFAPTVSLNTSITKSNISRFNTTEFGLSVGFRSTF